MNRHWYGKITECIWQILVAIYVNWLYPGGKLIKLQIVLCIDTLYSMKVKGSSMCRNE